jgi:predicted nuclease with TOPRIM domain
VKIIINDGAAGKELRDALRAAMNMKQDLAKTLQEVAEHQRDQERIKNEQPRIRENLKVLPDSDPLVKKLRDKLSQQETELETHEIAIRRLQEKADQERKDFEAYLASLNVE